jgi:hypothetical protein
MAFLPFNPRSMLISSFLIPKSLKSIKPPKDATPPYRHRLEPPFHTALQKV